MADAREKLSYLAWSACDKVDHIIDLVDELSFEEVHAAINRVRAHMEARSMQTATPLMLPVVNARGDDYEEPKGPPVEPMLMEPFEAGRLGVRDAAEYSDELKALLGL
jgi:hypothetical protein